MTNRGAFAAFLTVGLLEASLLVPKVSGAVPQLADTAAATAINGDLHRAAGNNLKAGLTIRDRAQALQRPALPDDEQATPSSAPSPSLDPERLQSGQPFTVEGVVVADEVRNGVRVIAIARFDDLKNPKVFAFHLADSRTPKQAVHSTVRVSGVFMTSMREPKTGGKAYLFDQGRIESQGGSATQAAPTGGAQEAQAHAATADDKTSFDTATKGWALRGTAVVDGHTTAVFVNGERTRYVQAGAELEPGVVVVRLASGQARLKVAGDSYDLIPW